MIEEVRSTIFYHVNSNANRSPHDLMRLGTTIEIGRSSNPFFGIYETWQRAYGVTDRETGEVSQVPAMRFLRRVQEGSITTDSLPPIAYEVANHFLMLARELVWENIRLSEFPEAPSRQRCIWFTRTLDQARQWPPIMKFQPGTHWIVKLRASGTALDVDGRLLAAESEPLPAWYDMARRYWRGEMSADPWPEVLFVGTVTVEEIIQP